MSIADTDSVCCILTVGPVLAKTKGKDAERAMNPSNPAATNLLLLGDRTRLLMLQHMQSCTQVNFSSDKSLDAEYQQSMLDFLPTHNRHLLTPADELYV